VNYNINESKKACFIARGDFCEKRQKKTVKTQSFHSINGVQ